jgi:hypothetical protein
MKGEILTICPENWKKMTVRMSKMSRRLGNPNFRAIETQGVERG